ncbi:cytochrome b5-like heme/steroid binding domain-containing protein [Kocuria sp. 2SI]|uniref:cytochrome b5 domain-containing protein n=1 Tax=Kocuria sp. 2SI TaxID=2502203 RepID=UPI0010F590FB|nr:cytochrome b5-like heme/steroid binding domain-containing protein [Kocuria sp. 2SI]
MNLQIPLQTSPFTAVGDLPLHPLVVHLPVVVLPLTAILLIVAAVVPAVRRRVLGLSVIGAALGLAGVILALISGDAFAQQVGMPQQHADAANRLLAASIALFVLTTAWWTSRVLADRKQRAEVEGAGALPTVLGALSALTGAAVLIFAVQTGHTGAQAAWSGAMATNAPAGTSAEESSSAATESEAETYTMDEVAEHDGAESCWAAIDGGVYDFSDWIAQHPGGEGAIESLCGSDGTEAFTGQHEGSDRVAEQLAEFRIGELAA